MIKGKFEFVKVSNPAKFLITYNDKMCFLIKFSLYEKILNFSCSNFKQFFSLRRGSKTQLQT